jgi:hypothetical protein
MTANTIITRGSNYDWEFKAVKANYFTNTKVGSILKLGSLSLDGRGVG